MTPETPVDRGTLEIEESQSIEAPEEHFRGAEVPT